MIIFNESSSLECKGKSKVFKMQTLDLNCVSDLKIKSKGTFDQHT